MSQQQISSTPGMHARRQTQPPAASNATFVVPTTRPSQTNLRVPGPNFAQSALRVASNQTPLVPQASRVVPSAPRAMRLHDWQRNRQRNLPVYARPASPSEAARERRIARNQAQVDPQRKLLVPIASLLNPKVETRAESAPKKERFSRSS